MAHEMSDLRALVTPEIRRRRNSEAKRMERRRGGMAGRQDYERDRRSVADRRAERLLALHEQGISWIEIGSREGLSSEAAQMAVRRYRQRRSIAG